MPTPACSTSDLLTKIADELAHVIAQVGSQPDAVLAEVAVVAPAEQAALDRLNLDTRVAYEFHSLPQMFEEQVARTPDAAAIVFHGQSISYRELQARANQVANLLVARGVKRGDLVGVLMDRSTEMVVSLWAVLKVGAAYVPLDPAYPSHRLAIMVEDARPALILTQAARIEQVAAVKAEAVAVDRPDTFDGVSTATPHVAIEAERFGLRDVHVGLDRPAQGGHGHARQHPELLSEARSRSSPGIRPPPGWG